MYSVILAIHLFVCVLLILSILLQSGKGSDLGSAFGGGSSDMFGPGAPANIMNKVTTVIATLFLLTSLTLAVLSSDRTSSSIMQQSAPAQNQPATQPAAPAEGGEQPVPAFPGSGSSGQ